MHLKDKNPKFHSVSSVYKKRVLRDSVNAFNLIQFLNRIANMRIFSYITWESTNLRINVLAIENSQARQDNIITIAISSQSNP